MAVFKTCSKSTVALRIFVGFADLMILVVVYWIGSMNNASYR